MSVAATAGTPPFPAGGGAVGALLRAQDWSLSPLGPPPGWPAALKTIAGMILAADQAMFVAWGPDRVLLYNDAYAAILGNRHPAALGRPFFEAWPELEDRVGPIMGRCLRGEPSHLDDLDLVVLRNGLPEEAHFSFFGAPIRDVEDPQGAVAGVFCACTEITGRVFAERTAAFRVALDERLRGLSDPTDVMAAAAAALGERLQAGQVAYAEIDRGGELAVIERDWSDGTIPSVAGRHRLADFGVASLRDGATVVVGDTRRDPRTAAPETLARLDGLSVAAFLNVPLFKAGRLAAVLCVNSAAPRLWSRADIAMAGEVAARTWEAVERARAEAAERRRAGQLQALAAASLAIAEAPTLKAMLEAVTRAAREIVGAHQGVVSLTEGPDWSQAITAVTLSDKYGGWRGFGTPPDGSGIYAWLCEQNRPVRMTQAEMEAHPRWRGFGRHASAHPPMRGWLAAPLVARDGRNLGLIQLSDKEDGSEFDALDEAIIVQLAQLASISVEKAQGDEVLRRTAEGLELALEAGATVGAWVWDVPSDLVVADERFARTFSLDPEQCRRGLPLGEVVACIHEEDQPRVAAAIEHTLAHGGFYRCEYRLRQPDGSYRWIEGSGRVERDAEGRPRRFPGVLIDIHDRWVAEEALRRSEALAKARAEEIEAIYESAPVGIVLFDRDFRFLRLNGHLAALNGIEVGDHAGRSIEEVLSPEVAAALRDIQPRLLAGEEIAGLEVLGTNAATGEQGAWLVSYRPLTDEQGAVRWLLGTVLDITARRRAEEALAAKEAQLRTILDTVPVGIVLAELPSGRIVEGNGQVETMLRHPVLLSPDIDSYDEWVSYHADGTRVSGHEYPLARMVLHGEEAPEIEVHYQRGDGTRAWTRIMGRPIRDARGAVVGGVIALVDIDAKRRAQDALARLNADLERQVQERTAQLVQLQKMEAIGRLTGGVAHDFNNVLQGLGSCLFMLERHVPEGTPRTLYQAAKQSIERGARLTQSLLAFARRQNLEPEPVEVPSLFDNMRPLLERTLGGMIGIDCRVAPGLPPVLADSAQLESALLNLAINARDAMPAGGRLTLRAEAAVLDQRGRPGFPPDLEPGTYVAISVADSGTGMDEATLARVFEPFFTTKEIGKGSGLGLSMVHGMAAQSGGGVHIESRVGGGTTVTLFLPRAWTEAAAAQAAAPEPERGGGRTILLVDDDEIVRMGTAALVEELGYGVVEANGGEAALEILRGGGRIDALVSDLAMPGMNGTELVRLARGLVPDLPVLIITGYADVPDGLHAAELLHKPFMPADLAARLAVILPERGLADSPSS